MTGAPELAVVLATDRYETIEPVVHSLREQGSRERLELVLVLPAGAAVDVSRPELRGFGGVRLVEVGSIEGLALARAAGIRAASAPAVFIGETHTFPGRGFAEELIAAHSGSWAAVVPGFGNANPDGVISWSNLLLDYGRWLHVLPARELEDGPQYNCSFDRELLVALGDRLAGLLDPGSDLFSELRRNGNRFAFRPSARVDHLNVGRPRAWLIERYLGGRLFAATRCARWSLSRRILYTFGSPLGPLVWLARVRPSVQAARAAYGLPVRVYTALVVGAAAWGLGELVGYSTGAGRAARGRMTEFELNKAGYAAPPAQ